MTPPEAVLFDNDGLLLDTEAVWTRGEQRLFEARGKEFTLDHKRSLVGSSEKVAAAKLVRFLDEPGGEKAIMEELNELVLEELESGVDAMVGGRELLKIPFTWPATAAQNGKAQGATELGQVTLAVKP